MAACDQEEPAIETAAANAAANGVSIQLERTNLREHLPALAPIAVANLSAPILITIAAQLSADPREVATLICSGVSS